MTVFVKPAVILTVLAALFLATLVQAQEPQQEWVPVPLGNTPSPCSEHSLTAVGTVGLYLFGGRDANGQLLNDLYVLDFAGGSEIPISVSFICRCSSVKVCFS
ncbi:MAG: Kelch repeat-containing protein [Chloroflexota bacterium]